MDGIGRDSLGVARRGRSGRERCGVGWLAERRSGMEGRGRLGPDRSGRERPGPARRGRQGERRNHMARLAEERHGRSGRARTGVVWSG